VAKPEDWVFQQKVSIFKVSPLRAWRMKKLMERRLNEEKDIRLDPNHEKRIIDERGTKAMGLSDLANVMRISTLGGNKAGKARETSPLWVLILRGRKKYWPTASYGVYRGAKHWGGGEGIEKILKKVCQGLKRLRGKRNKRTWRKWVRKATHEVGGNRCTKKGREIESNNKKRRGRKKRDPQSGRGQGFEASCG